MARKRILIVDDDAVVRRGLERLLGSLGYVIYSADGLPQAIQLLESKRLDLLITDDNMPSHHDGVVLIAYLRSIGLTIPAILHSGFGLEQIRENCQRKGVPHEHVTHFVEKGSPSTELIKTVQELIGESGPESKR